MARKVRERTPQVKQPEVIELTEEVEEVTARNIYKTIVLASLGMVLIPACFGAVMHGIGLAVWRAEEYLGHRLDAAKEALAMGMGYEVLAEAQQSHTIDEWIDVQADKNGVHPDLVRALIKIESTGNPWATSSVGAMGLMQLMPDTCKRLGLDPAQCIEPFSNVENGTKWLAMMLKQAKGNVHKGLRMYNCTPQSAESGKQACIDYADNVLARLATRNFAKVEVSATK